MNHRFYVEDENIVAVHILNSLAAIKKAGIVPPVILVFSCLSLAEQSGLFIYLICLTFNQFEFPPLLAKFAFIFLEKRNISEISARRNRIEMAEVLGRKTGV
jgi:hypothetical protein